jgi:hypothetical protein
MYRYLILCLCSTCLVPILGKRLKGRVLLRKRPSTGAQVGTKLLCRLGNSNGLDLKALLA